MLKVREINRTYFNKNAPGRVLCEYCFRKLPNFDHYRYSHVRTCAAKSMFKFWKPNLKDLEIELYGEYKYQKQGGSPKIVYGHLEVSNVDTDGDDNNMSDRGTGTMHQVTFTSPTTATTPTFTSPTTPSTPKTSGSNYPQYNEQDNLIDLSLDDDFEDIEEIEEIESDANLNDNDGIQHRTHMEIETAIIQNIADNTTQGRKRMAAIMKKKGKRDMDSDSEEIEEEADLDYKVNKFRENIVDFSGVPGLNATVRKFIEMS